MMVSRTALAALLAGLGLLLAPGARPAAAEVASTPAVVVSIKPIHSLVASVMAGVALPQLLIAGAGSPHSYALRPSQARALDQAELIFWVGDGLELFLTKPLEALSGDAKVVALGSVDGLHTLATRSGGLWDGHEAESGPQHADRQRDMHLWLDPRNAAVMADAIAAALSEVDPDRGPIYQANAAQLGADLARLDADIAAHLTPVRDRPFVVLHDGYHYLVDRYGLNAVGAIAVDPQRRPGAGRLRAIRAELMAREATCVFAEPQFGRAVVEAVVNGTTANIGVLDPLGADLTAGPGLYAELMDRLSRSLVACLDAPRSG